ncbi:MAG: dTDP-4-dehydrorhamnose reductase [Thermoleophilia bacterium]|nr:dTDP-4-dehydrorhamnose reductase [Thermoleophilia bacterium]
MEHPHADPLQARFGRLLITGAGGQLGRALAEAFPWADARPRERLDVGRPFELRYRPDAVLHAAAWTAVDAAEADPDGAERTNVGGVRRVAALGAPVLLYSTDYVFDGRKRSPYVESDSTNPRSVYGRTKLAGEREVRRGWVVRTSWLFGPTGTNFLRTMLRLGAERGEVRVVSDQRGSPTYVGHLARATRELLTREYGTWHVAAQGECTWAEFAEAIFEDAGLTCRVVPISTAEYGAPAPRPAYSVLRSERAGAPTLPHWRAGVRDCLARLGVG